MTHGARGTLPRAPCPLVFGILSLCAVLVLQNLKTSALAKLLTEYNEPQVGPLGGGRVAELDKR